MQDKQSKASLESRKNTAARTWKLVLILKLACGVATEKVADWYYKTAFLSI